MAHGPIPDKPIGDERLARVAELKEEVAALGANYDEFGAEWGDRYTESLSEREQPLVEQAERAKRRSRTVFINGKRVDLPGQGETSDLATLQDRENAVWAALAPEQKAAHAKTHLAYIERYRS